MPRSNPFSPCRLVRATALLITCAAAAAHAQDDCDCSCEAYHEFLNIAQNAAEAADSGEAPRVPSELMAMSQCTSTCAMAWSGCQKPVDSGPSGTTAPDSAQDKAQLTSDYLEGTWCSVYNDQEVTQWRFDDRGHYRIGVAAGDGWAMQPTRHHRDDFMGRVQHLVAFESNGFTIRDINQGVIRDTVFTRSGCG